MKKLLRINSYEFVVEKNQSIPEKFMSKTISLRMIKYTFHYSLIGILHWLRRTCSRSA